MTLQELYYKLVLNLLENVMEVCKDFGGSITSFGRSEIHNFAIKGGATSWHLDWLAMDVFLDDKNSGPNFVQNLKQRGFRVLPTGSNKNMAQGDVNLCRSFHIQYNWPVIKDFKRENYLSHFKEMVIRYSQIFKEYGEIEI